MPAYVKLVLANDFPRTLVTSRLAGGRALYYGPFRTRGSAELFENQLLDLFQIRRCQENLEPSAQHPGCIYGEMNMCLRPCQLAVSREEYGSEVGRVEEFLRGDGAALVNVTSAARDRLSEEMNFEAAAASTNGWSGLRACSPRATIWCRTSTGCTGSRLPRASAPDSVVLWFICQGSWQQPCELALTSQVSLDARLKELVAGFQPVAAPLSERQEHLALLARWHYSSWSDGEWIGFRGLNQAPYRKLVRAISRVRQKAEASGEQ